MGYDPASFDEEQKQAVYPPGIRRCFITAKAGQADAHHVLGRGNFFGIRLADPRRKLFSSIYNLAWLDRDVHNGPARDDYRLRDYFLERARKEIQLAIIKKEYEATEIDREFLALAEKWKQKAFASYGQAA
jgi:hypothetical protein